MGNWIPQDPTLVAQILKICSTYTPPPPEGFVSPMTWGLEKDVMERLSYCCDADDISPAGTPYDERKFKKRKIYDSTVEKARDMVRLYKEFNLSNNTELSESIAMLENTLRDVTVEMLRESDAVRAEVKEGVDEILNRFGAFKCFEE